MRSTTGGLQQEAFKQEALALEYHDTQNPFHVLYLLNHDREHHLLIHHFSGHFQHRLQSNNVQQSKQQSIRRVNIFQVVKVLSKAFQTINELFLLGFNHLI